MLKLLQLIKQISRYIMYKDSHLSSIIWTVVIGQDVRTATNQFERFGSTPLSIVQLDRNQTEIPV